jgi:REP-associated tyrosine transposase
MPRRVQRGSGGIVFHVLNRGARRSRLFEEADDYLAFLRVLCEAQARVGMPLLCFALMPNHWHLVVCPVHDGDLPRFMQWLSRTHAQRWQLNRHSVGTGAVYQGRFRASPVQSDGHFLTVCRYVERNPLRAGLVGRVEDWRWSSAWPDPEPGPRPALAAWPIDRPADWLESLNGAEPDRGLDRLRKAIRRQIPFGEVGWGEETATRLGLTPAWRGRGRPPAPSGSRFPCANGRK